MARIGLAVAMCCALWGCGKVLGTNDVELSYRVPLGRNAARLVRDRLSTASIIARVTHDGDEDVRVVVDAREANLVDELLRWESGLQVYTLDPTYALRPDDARGLAEHRDDSHGVYFSGSINDVLRTALETRDPTHRFLADLDSEPRARIVRRVPLLSLDVTSARATGTTVEVHVRQAHPAARGLRELGNDRVALAIGSQALWVGRLRDAAPRNPAAGALRELAIERPSPARAAHTARLIVAPVLPHLTPLARRLQPTNWLLAIGSIAVPILLGLAWVVFVRRFDRAQPEPWWLVLATFALGGVSAIVAALIETAISSYAPRLSAHYYEGATDLPNLGLSFVAFTFSVGIIEEGVKLLGAWSLAMHRHEFDEPVDGIVYGAASSLGFASIENVMYFTVDRLDANIVAARTLMAISAHTLFGALWGYALGMRLVSKRGRVLPFFLLAALAHGIWDAATTSRIPFVNAVLQIALTVAFIVLLRRALRWGPIARGSEVVAVGNRMILRLGRRVRFVLSVVATFVLGLVLIVFGAVVEMDTARIGIGTVAIGVAIVTLLGLAAFFVAETMPLDVVLDERGVTFGGAVRNWADVTEISRTRQTMLVVHARSGDLKLGPGTPHVIDAVETSVRARLLAKAGLVDG